MYRIVLLSACVVVALGHGPDHKCMKLMHPESIACCKKEFADYTKDEDIQECFQIPHKPRTCDREMCVAVKKGVASSDGTVDKKALIELLTKNLEKEPGLLDSIKDQCIDGDLDKYGPPDFCNLMKLNSCIKTQYIDYCPEWDDSGNCSGMKDLVTECKMKLA